MRLMVMVVNLETRTQRAPRRTARACALRGAHVSYSYSSVPKRGGGGDGDGIVHPEFCCITQQQFYEDNFVQQLPL